MSDFFGDDFTAELKSYFLESINKEADNFLDLVEDSNWQKIRTEFYEKCSAWAADARTNEFTYLAQWLDVFGERSQLFNEAKDLTKAIQTFKSYIEALAIDKTDSAEISLKFALTEENLREVVLLHCHQGEEDFAVPLLNVIEISGNLPLFPLPERQHGILGVIPYRGEAVPVLNLRDYGFGQIGSEKPCYVICDFSGKLFSLAVSKAEDLFKIKETEIQNVKEHTFMSTSEFVNQFFIKGEKNIMLLDFEKLVA